MNESNESDVRAAAAIIDAIKEGVMVFGKESAVGATWIQIMIRKRTT